MSKLKELTLNFVLRTLKNRIGTKRVSKSFNMVSYRVKRSAIDPKLLSMLEAQGCFCVFHYQNKESTLLVDMYYVGSDELTVNISKYKNEAK